MTKLPSDYDTPRVPHSYAPFSDELLSKIIEDAKVNIATDGMPISQAARILNYAALMLPYAHYELEFPPESAMKASRAKVREHATELRRLIRLTSDLDDKEPPGYPSPTHGTDRLLGGPMEKLMRRRLRQIKKQDSKLDILVRVLEREYPPVVLGLLAEFLDLVIASASSDEHERFPFPVSRTNPAIERFAKAAAFTYVYSTGLMTLPFSRNAATGEPGGPLIRFLEACCSHLGEPVRPDALVRWIRTWRKDGTELRLHPTLMIALEELEGYRSASSRSNR